MARKKIHFAMIEAGGGHKTPALAVVEALEENFPGKYEIKVLDFIKDLGFQTDYFSMMPQTIIQRWWSRIRGPTMQDTGFHVTTIQMIK